MAQALNLSVSLVKTRKADEKQRQIALIGQVSHQIVGAKLPTNRQVLQVFFYNMRFVKLTSRKSANLTIDAVLIFWQQARIPTRRQDKCVDLILKIYEDWKTYNKVSVEKIAGKMKQKFDVFMDVLDDIFDIAAVDALTIMKNDEDKEFLKKQRQKGRPGSMLGVDMTLAAKEERSKLRKEKEEERKLRHERASESQQSGE